MASYCDFEDLGRFGINAAALEGTPAEDQGEPVIAAWGDYIDSYLGAHAADAAVAWDDALKDCNATFAARQLLDVIGRKPAENPEDTAIDRACDRWQKWLESISAGDLTPVVTPPGSGGEAAPGAPLVLSNATRGWQDVTGGTPSGVAFAGRRP